ncbi:MAG: twin-arginine translocase subunit TatC [Alphaproteobacteria bacterium]
MLPEKEKNDNQEKETTTMPIMEHIRELRRRLIKCILFFVAAFFISYSFASNILNILINPLAQIMAKNGGTNRMIYTNLTEGFFTYLKIGSFGAICLSFPFFIWHIWQFIAPGLYKNEKRAVLPFIIASPVLFIMGALLVYFMIIPMAWSFLMGFQSSFGQTVLPIQLEARISEYLSLIMTLIMAFGLCFQMPVFLVLLAYAGIITPESLIKFRKYAIVLIFFVAAVVTPPDIISQVGLAIPLIMLYEITIKASAIVIKNKEQVQHV